MANGQMSKTLPAPLPCQMAYNNNWSKSLSAGQLYQNYQMSITLPDGPLHKITRRAEVYQLPLGIECSSIQKSTNWLTVSNGQVSKHSPTRLIYQIDWLTDWVIDWLTFWLTHSLTHLFIHSITLTHSLTDQNHSGIMLSIMIKYW